MTTKPRRLSNGLLAVGPSRRQFIVAASAVALFPVGAAAGTPGRFYIFNRPGGARVPVTGETLGHVGFGFATDETYYVVGAVENAHNNNSPQFKDMFLRNTSNPVLIMGANDNVHATPPWQTRYEFYKYLDVPSPRASAARHQCDVERSYWFVVGLHDCRTAALDVYNAYGGPPLGHAVESIKPPNEFFNALPGAWGPPKPILIPWPGSTLDVSFYESYDQQGFRDDVVGLQSNYVVFDNLYPDNGSNPTDTNNLVATYRSTVLVRQGYVGLYNRHHCDGAGNHTMVTPADGAKNFKNLGWPENQVRSWCASSEPFDPANPPLAAGSFRNTSMEAALNYERFLRQQP